MNRQARLLVVDDNEANRNVLSRLLHHKGGYHIMVASDGAEALALCERETFDLVLLDVEMPVMGGLEALERLRSVRAQTELPVIMVTARTEGRDIVEAFRLGANDYVTKPVDFAVALARIQTHLSHKWAVEALSVSEERYTLAVRGSRDGLWDWDLVTDQVHWSPRWKAMLGCEDRDITASSSEWLSRVHPDDAVRVRERLAAHLESGAGHFECEHRLLHSSGTYRWVLCRGAAVRNSDGKPARIAGSFTDITDAKVADALTGLPNRLLFDDLLERAWKRSRRRAEYVFALLVLGLDRFRAVNDSLGPVTADKLLAGVAKRLQSSLRSTDTVTREATGYSLARLTGDEFTVLVEDIAEAADAALVAQRLQAALREPFDIDGHQVYTTASIGIAVSTTGYEHPGEILRDAATALHRAKSHDTATIELFDPAMRARAVTRMQLEMDLRKAIADSTLKVHYQPIVCLSTGTIAGAEALVRWSHPTRGAVEPSQFIPVAEDTGLLVDIGRFVLAQACREMVRWRAAFPEVAPRVICVNVSGRQFADNGLINEIEAILGQTGLDSSHLHLEITESALIGDMTSAHDTLNRLHSIGVEWSIDDFGTGYSSLSYLHRLRAGTVKVDQSFVGRLGQDERASQMVGAIVTLAHNFDMRVVAEGVETREQLAAVRSLGCDYAQGFYFSRAVESCALDDMIATQPWRLSEIPPSANRQPSARESRVDTVAVI